MRKELQKQLDRLDKQRRALLEELERLTAEQMAFTPGPGKWSILEVMEHLVISEREIFKCVPEQLQKGQGISRLRNHLAYFLVVVILKLGLPVPVVSHEMEPEGRSSLNELHQQWDENHRWLRSFLEQMATENLESPVFCHPVAGPLTLGQSIQMARLHLNAHLSQIKRNKRIMRITL
jgi:uncharacterized damage-inducible protein DinB